MRQIIRDHTYDKFPVLDLLMLIVTHKSRARMIGYLRDHSVRYDNNIIMYLMESIVTQIAEY